MTEIFSRKHLKCQTWLPQGRKCSGKKISSLGQGKVREFHFKSGEVLWTYNHHIVHEIEQQADSGCPKKSILFARYC